MKLYQGLLKMQQLKLPHPDWQFVVKGQGLSDLKKISAYAGWTIRTVKVSSGQYQNIYDNWVPRNQVGKMVDKFQRKLSGRGLFVVYPSWRWQVGGTLLIEKNRQVVEAAKGAITDLARHGVNDVCYIFKKGQIDSINGQKILSKKILVNLQSAIKALSKGNYYLEWAVTTQGKFIFYRLNDLKSEARLLMNKYK